MAYRLSFFCRAGEDTGQAALERLLDELLAKGAPLLGEWHGPYVDAVAGYSLATKGSSGEPAADWLTLEVHVGVRSIAESVIAASPNDEQGIWGSDLLATVTLSGDSPDWPLVGRIWRALVDLWSAVPWDEMSGFEIAMDPVAGAEGRSPGLSIAPACDLINHAGDRPCRRCEGLFWRWR